MTFADVAPYVVGILLSPFPMIPMIILLGSGNPRASGGGYLVGWAAALAAVVLVFAGLMNVLEPPAESPTWASWLRVVVGLLLLVLAVRQWLQRHQAKDPAWLQTLATAGPGAAAKYGALMAAANPKILVFGAGAGATIGVAETTPQTALLWTVVMVGAASVAILLPYIAALIAGDRVMPTLVRVREWLRRNNAAITAVVFLILGLLLLSYGVSSLRG